MKTKLPVRRNGNPKPDEMAFRRAIHILQDVCNDQLVLMHDDALDIYLIPSIMGEDDRDEDTGKMRLKGRIEYQVSDGLPGYRNHSNDFENLWDAIHHFEDVQFAGGWKEYLEKNQKTPAA